MSQFGMQMQGVRTKRGGTVDIYTGLAVAACVALAAAAFFLFTAAKSVGVDGNPFGMQEAGRIKIATTSR